MFVLFTFFNAFSGVLHGFSKKISQGDSGWVGNLEFLWFYLDSSANILQCNGAHRCKVFFSQFDLLTAGQYCFSQFDLLTAGQYCSQVFVKITAIYEKTKVFFYAPISGLGSRNERGPSCRKVRCL